MAFNDVEMAILSQLSYRSLPDSCEKKSLYKMLTENEKWLNEKMGSQYADAIEQLKSKAKEENCIIEKTENNRNGTGFAAMAISNKYNEVTVACRGTEPSTMADLSTDAQIALGDEFTDQDHEMMRFMEELQADYDFDKFYFTGHSLGGHLAMIGTIMIDDPSKLGGTVTYNAPGLNQKFWDLFGNKIKMTQGTITNYQNEYDGISNACNVPGKIIVLEAVDSDKFGGSAHSFNYFKLDENGNFVVSETGKKGSALQVIFGVVTTITDNWDEIKAKIKNGIYKTFPALILVDVACWCIKSVYVKLKTLTKAYKDATNHPHIKIDTALMEDYAALIKQANNTITRLDFKLDSLYKELSLSGKYKLARADFSIGYSFKLERIRKYLKDTADEFFDTEMTIKNTIV